MAELAIRSHIPASVPPGRVAEMEAGAPRTGVRHQSSRVEIRIVSSDSQVTLGIAPRAERQLLAAASAGAEQTTAQPDPGHGSTRSAASTAGSVDQVSPG